MDTTDDDNTGVALSDGYRSARRTASAFAGIAIAWAFAQLEIGAISLPGVDEVSVRSGGIPLLLAAAVVYSMTRCLLEYFMQPLHVTESRLSKIDVKLTTILGGFALLSLSCSRIARTTDSLFLVFAACIIVGALYVAVERIFAINFFRASARRMKKVNGVGPSIARACMGVMMLSFVVSTLLMLIVFPCFGIFLLGRYHLLLGLVQPPSHLDAGLFFVGCCLFMAILLRSSYFLVVAAAIAEGFEDPSGDEVSIQKDPVYHSVQLTPLEKPDGND